MRGLSEGEFSVLSIVIQEAGMYEDDTILQGEQLAFLSILEERGLVRDQVLPDRDGVYWKYQCPTDLGMLAYRIHLARKV